MTIEVSLLISGVSLALAVYFGMKNMKRNETADAKAEASQLTTVIVKLETIGTGIARIENEITNMKSEFKEDHERLVKVEEAVKSAHRRMDTCEKFCKGFTGGNDE